MSTHKTHPKRKKVIKRKRTWHDHALVFLFFIILASLTYAVG